MVVVNAFRTYGQNDKFFPYYYLVYTSTQCKRANTSKYQIIKTSAISVDGWGSLTSGIELRKASRRRIMRIEENFSG